MAKDQITSNSINIPPFSLVKKDVELVKPSKPTPSEILSFSSIDNLIGLETLTPTIFVYQPINSYKSHPSDHDHENINNNNNDHHDDQLQDPAEVIKEALSNALVYYYPLAGRLKRQQDDGRLRLTCNANGVPFLVATADCSLSSLNYFDGIDIEIAKEFIFASPPSDCPLVFQVTKFLCGGFAIGFEMSHSVCDGFGATQFFRAVAELSRGQTEPTVKPVWERERLVGEPINGPLPFLVDKGSLAISPYLSTSEIVHECLSIKSEGVKRLKEASSTGSNSNFTTIEIVGAFVWRARFRALKLNPDGKTTFFLTTGVRKFLDPPLPEGYYGNAFLSSTAELMGKDLNEQPLIETAKLIKECKKVVFDKDFIKKSIDTFETLISQNMNVKIEASGATTVLTDWRNLGLMEEIGFAWKPVNITALPWNMFGYVDLCFLLPPAKSDGSSARGGARILVSLPRPAMAKFKEEMAPLIS
ncbi:10-deacetylbaccatin III 10-O-acetyltransferase [Morus notabilis]|uniref:10-deacetylbaccatin III 10-O-acetyltransferase n=1 Tax=Morus notabilis TaxID=981085 RepID=W9R7E2_9ROSA|nr:spermidine coumaroyl-CoA acyltransferase [Morus notabilis]EXB56623.1 10-deacetylbaccatin III 10-O-acetyltransferase [Morus notabilis]